MVLPISYWKIDDAEIFQHFATIADAISIPIMAYNNPATSGTDMSPELICRMAREIDNVEMIKESSGDLNRMRQIQTISNGELPFYNGYNPMAQEAFAAGASGWCTAAANLIPELNNALYQAHQQTDVDQAHLIFQQQLPLLNFMMSKSLPATVKCGLELLEVPVGAPRLPLFPLSVDQGEELSKILQSLGIPTVALEQQ
jgi:4-hydroxy-tetrahydrodipicolinate synthase